MKNKFQIGDIVEYTGEDTYKGTHIIVSSRLLKNGKYIYYTTFSDWLNEKDFILIKKASKKSIKQLIKELKKENYDEE